MTLVVSRAPHLFYLSSEQYNLCVNLDPRIRDLISHCSFPKNAAQVDTILNFYAQNHPKNHERITVVFLRVFQTLGVNNPTAIMSEIQKLVATLEEPSATSIATTTASAELRAEITALRQEYGELFCSTLLEALQRDRIPSEERLPQIKKVRLLCHENHQASEAINEFIGQRLSCRDFIEALTPRKIFPMETTNKEDLSRLKQRFAQMPFPLDPASLKKIFAQLSQIQKWQDSYAGKNSAFLANEIRSLQTGKLVGEKDLLRAVAIAVCAIRLHFTMDLHPVQILTVLGELLFPTSCLAQVNTGEGKSMIVTLLAFLLVLKGKTVHIISSGANLAMRDQQESVSFFALFDITTSHICKQHPDRDSFQAKILYGAASDFEFAIMREMLYCTPLFPNSAPSQPSAKRFDCVIVDEVDNLTIDTLGHGARLGYPAEIAYEWIYFPILQFVKQRKEGNVTQLKGFLGHDPRAATISD
ncbi:MAG: Uncharacterized protein HW387_738 [Parachlamydiales bacterium]|nr:Uncharacterized protein [Parachlamydiales bacterium]